MHDCPRYLGIPWYGYSRLQQNWTPPLLLATRGSQKTIWNSVDAPGALSSHPSMISPAFTCFRSRLSHLKKWTYNFLKNNKQLHVEHLECPHPSWDLWWAAAGGGGQPILLQPRVCWFRTSIFYNSYPQKIHKGFLKLVFWQKPWNCMVFGWFSMGFDSISRVWA